MTIICCLDIDECTSNPCRNNGTCQHNVNVYDCVCSVCYTGVHCEKQLDKCFEIPTGDDSNVSGGDGVSAATVAGSVVSSSLFVLGIVIFVVVFKFGWLKGPSKAKNPNAKQSVADSMVPEKLGIQGKYRSTRSEMLSYIYNINFRRPASIVHHHSQRGLCLTGWTHVQRDLRRSRSNGQ